MKKDLIKKINDIRSKAAKNKQYGFDLKFVPFLEEMFLLNPQSYGTRIESRLRHELDWKKIDVKEEKGDLLSKDLKQYEVKVSLITSTNRTLNLVQVRLWQKVNYLCFWFNFEDYKFSFYELTTAQMQLELKKLKCTAAHGKLTNLEIPELRASLKIDDNNPDFIRWESKYKTDKYDYLLNK